MPSKITQPVSAFREKPENKGLVRNRPKRVRKQERAHVAVRDSAQASEAGNP